MFKNTPIIYTITLEYIRIVDELLYISIVLNNTKSLNSFPSFFKLVTTNNVQTIFEKNAKLISK